MSSAAEEDTFRGVDARRASAKNIVILSPHLDDGVFSLGATALAQRAAGASVRIVTAFANDPESDAAATEWDVRSGFDSVQDSALARRREDALACRLVGAEPDWLTFPSGDYRTSLDETALADSIVGSCAEADLVFVPAFPLVHPDHALLARVTLAAASRLPELALYVEQPYAAWEWVRECPGEKPKIRDWLPVTVTVAETERALVWRPLGFAPARWSRKLLASMAYKSQMRGIGRLAVPRIARYELRRGIEATARVPR